MKRLLSTIYAVVLITLCAIQTSALSNAVFSLQADNISTNRQFNINIYIDSSENISAGRLSVTYDNSVAVYKGISSDIYQVDAKDNGEYIDIVFASAYKVDCSDNIKAISLQFKSIDNGQFDVKLECSECVDYNLKDVTVKTDTTTLSVYENSVKVKSGNSSKDKSTRKGDKSEISSIDEDTSGLSEASTYIGGMNTTQKAALIGISSGFIVIIMFVLGVLIGRKTDKSKTDDKTDS